MAFLVVIAGGRDFTDYDLLKIKLNSLLINKSDVEIVSGGAAGADKLGERYAHETGRSLKVFPADWRKHGRSAGMIRNGVMLDYCDAVVCFWDGRSSGTRNMIDRTRRSGKPLRVVRY